MGLDKPGRLRVDQPTITGELGPAPDAYTHYSPVMITALSKTAGRALLMKAALFSAPSRRPAKVCAVTRGDRVATLEEANLHCQKSWSTCKAWATLDEGPLTPLSPLAAITNRRRFSVHLLCGVTRFRRGGATRFRRDRYL